MKVDDFLRMMLARLDKCILDRLDGAGPGEVSNSDIENSKNLYEAVKKLMDNEFNFKDFLSGELMERLVMLQYLLSEFCPPGDDLLNKEISVAMTVRDALSVAKQAYEFEQLKNMKKLYATAFREFDESTDRTSKKLTKFANTIGLTEKRRPKKRDDWNIFIDYVALVKGIDCPKLSKKDACEVIMTKYGLTEEALKTVLKKVHAEFPGRFKAVLP